ncbi:HAD hydrolase-like protein [Cytobacillus firmus]|uniref:HAD hydrolase-like protein n=1 Tax=Cytobacillus firmus TaxID=1399 RepID=UPI001CFE1297|nr:HAD hydrolase-like protein [Cytobacillus firmus]
MNVLWDLDGTILDTWPTLVRSFIRISGKELDPQEVLTPLKNGTAYQKFDVPPEKIADFRQMEATFMHAEKPLFPYVRGILERNNVNVLVTHRNRQSTEELLEYWKLTSYFEEVICPEFDGFSLKPHPESYEYLHRRYHIDLAIGDQDTDLMPARQIGISTCAFRSTNPYADFSIDCYSKFEIAIR